MTFLSDLFRDSVEFVKSFPDVGPFLIFFVLVAVGILYSRSRARYSEIIGYCCLACSLPFAGLAAFQWYGTHSPFRFMPEPAVDKRKYETMIRIYDHCLWGNAQFET